MGPVKFELIEVLNSRIQIAQQPPEIKKPALCGLLEIFLLDAYVFLRRSIT